MIVPVAQPDKELIPVPEMPVDPCPRPIEVDMYMKEYVSTPFYEGVSFLKLIDILEYLAEQVSNEHAKIVQVLHESVSKDQLCDLLNFISKVYIKKKMSIICILCIYNQIQIHIRKN